MGRWPSWTGQICEISRGWARWASKLKKMLAHPKNQ